MPYLTPNYGTIAETPSMLLYDRMFLNVANDNVKLKWHKKVAEHVRFNLFMGIASGRYTCGIHPNIAVRGSAEPEELRRKFFVRKKAMGKHHKKTPLGWQPPTTNIQRMSR